MSRTVERTIDLLATGVLLCFAWLLVMASISFWLGKNAGAPDSPAHREAAAAVTAAAAQTAAAALAAAEVIRTATAAAQAVTATAAKEPERTS